MHKSSRLTRKELDDITIGEFIEACPFCNKKPMFHQSVSNDHVIFIHDCTIVKFHGSVKREDYKHEINRWNNLIEKARKHFDKVKSVLIGEQLIEEITIDHTSVPLL